MAWTNQKIAEVYAEVKKQAAMDEQFRNELMENTVAVIERIAGETLPEDHSINVLDFSLTGEVMSDSDLENVAGGRDVEALPTKGECCNCKSSL